MADTFSCPECGVKLRRSPHLRSGARVQCPRCSVQFPVPPEEQNEPTPASPPRQDNPDPGGYSESPVPRGGIDREDSGTAMRRADDPPRRRPVRSDDDFDYPIRRKYDEDEDYPRYARGRIGHPDDLSNAYRINQSLWFAYAREHWGQILGQAVGYQILLFFIGQSIVASLGVPGLIAQLFLMPPLEAGLMIVCLAQLTGRRWAFGDFFAGFRHYWPTVLLALVRGAIALVLVVPVATATTAVIIAHDGPEKVPPRIWLGLVGLAGVLALPVLYVNIRLFFALPLILDRNFSGGEAMSGSWMLTRGHFLGLLGVELVMVLMHLGGVLLCFIGVWFVFPYTTLAAAAGYLLVAGTRPPFSRQGLEGSAEPDNFTPDEDY